MMAILSIVLLAIAVVSAVLCVTESFKRPWISLIALIIGLIALIIYVYVPSLTIGLGLFQQADPTKQDVINGKAYYQETQVITGNDTIKTYDIVWK